MTGVTHILNAIEGGDPAAAKRLLPWVYDELRRLAAQRLAAQRLAAQRLAHERPGQTLDATVLVNEFLTLHRA